VRPVVLLVFGACSFGVPAQATTDAPDRDAPPNVTAPACFGARCRRITITVDHTKVVGGPHTDFPLFVDVSDAMLDRGSVFTTADGSSVLPYERDAQRLDTLLAWVRLPSLPSDHDTVIQLYTGDPAAPDMSNAAAVWDIGYQAVWHTSETSGGNAAILDSTSHANHGTDLGGPAVGATGKLGRAVMFDGNDDALRIPASASLTSSEAVGTLSMWIDWANITPSSFERLLMTTNTFAGDGSGMEWAINANGQYYYYPAVAGAGNYTSIMLPFTAGVWSYIVLTQELATKTVRMYVDGTERMKDIDGVATMWNSTPSLADWYWGGTPGNAKVSAVMDEIRVSNVIRSPGWIATEYANQSAPLSFYALVATGP
jgi:hypothetical protein